MAFLLDEDEALKARLTGYEVTDQNGAVVSIPVYFRFPDIEERNRTFPHIAIDLIEAVFDPTRAMRALGFMNDPGTGIGTTTSPAGYLGVGDDAPLPWTLIYQIATYARQPRVDRQLQVLMLFQFPEQFGSLDMTAIDGTIRRADLISAVRRDTVDANQKRLYRNIYTIHISSEFSLYQIQQIQQATEIIITNELYFTVPGSQQAGTTLQEVGVLERAETVVIT